VADTHASVPPFEPVPLASGDVSALVVPIFLGVGIAASRLPYVYVPHQHDAYQVILVDRGVYHCSVNGHAMTLGANEVLIVKPGDWHEDACGPSVRYFFVNFDFVPMRQGPKRLSLFADDVTVAQQRFGVDRGLFRPLMKRIQKEGQLHDASAAHIQEALLVELLWSLVRAIPRGAISRPFLALSVNHGLRAQLARVFKANETVALSVAEMARLLNMSESSLSHTCKHVLGVSPARAFLRHKMNRAHELLRRSTMTVKEVAASLGFEDPYHFSRVFKSVLGHPPSAGR
jgi:AraC-like DNA-binding protein